jgi:hypothetical protein
MSKRLDIGPTGRVIGRLCGKRRGSRFIRWRGVESVQKPYNKLPTLLADALLPWKEILKIFHLSVEIVADINAEASPHVQVQQIFDAPTASIKLDVESNLIEVWRFMNSC